MGRVLLIVVFALGCARDPDPQPGFVVATRDAFEFSTGPRAHGAPGDFLLANDHVVFTIATVRATVFSPWGGGIIDAELTEAPSRDRLSDLFARVGDVGVSAPDGVVITDDGLRRGSTQASIQQVGTVRDYPVFGGSTSAATLTYQTDYTIRPVTHHLEIDTTVFNDGADAVNVTLDDHLGFGADAHVYESGDGLDPNWLVATYDDIAYGWVPGELRLTPSEVTIPAGGQASYRRLLFVGADAGQVTADIYDTLGVPTGTLTGFIRDLAGDIAEDASLDVRASDGRFLARLVPDDNGAFRTQMPADRLELVASSARRGSADPLFIDVQGGRVANVIVLLPATGLVQFRAIDEATTSPIPARLRLFRGGELVDEAVHDGLTTEPVTARALPGQYIAVVSRGPEWTSMSSTVQVLAGQTVPASFDGTTIALRRAVATTGYLAVEPSVRTLFSDEGTQPAQARFNSLVAEGIEAVTFANPNWFVASTTSALANSEATVWLGREAYSPGGGRFAGWPAVGSQFGAQAFFDPVAGVLRPLDEVAAHVSPVTVMDPLGVDGYLNTPSFNAALIDALEISSPTDLVFTQWLDLVSQGSRITAIASGNGYPRTYAGVGDDPSAATPGDYADALEQGRALVSTGPFVDAALESGAQTATLGETLDASGTGCAVDVVLHIESPAWASFNQVTVLSDAPTTQAVTPTLVDGRFVLDATIPITPTADTFAVIIVEGDGTMFPVSETDVFAFTNPIYIDCAGDGWQPPG